MKSILVIVAIVAVVLFTAKGAPINKFLNQVSQAQANAATTTTSAIHDGEENEEIKFQVESSFGCKKGKSSSNSVLIVLPNTSAFPHSPLGNFFIW